LEWVEGYKITFSHPVVQVKEPVEPGYSDKDRAHFDEAINNLLSIGAISECVPCEGQFVSSIFLTPKPNGKMRLILNLKNLNKFIDTTHFKLEDLRTAVKLVTPDCYLAIIDLKDAYFSIKVHEHSRKYLRFYYSGKLYEYNALAFGLNTSPYIFTKITKPVVKLLRSAGFLSTVYLDDWLLLGKSKHACLENIKVTKALLTSLGFIVNKEKSVLTPAKSCKFLGIVIDTQCFNLSLPSQKRTHIQSELKQFMKLKRCKIRKLAQIAGLLVSACPAIEYGWLYTKEIERCKFLALQENDNYDRFVTISDTIKPDLTWWMLALDKSVHPIRDDVYCKEIFSDASTKGWGISCGSDTASGLWSISERQYHINFLELLAAFVGLKIFAKDLSHCQILLRIDNTTAISYVNRMGGIQYPHLTQIAKDIWQWCEHRNIFIYASYIRSIDNTIADAESRKNHPDIEWELSGHCFLQLVKTFGQPEIDLFASRINHKCQKYISWHRDPDAFAINSFTVTWAGQYFYAFPPVSMILKTLRKIISDEARGILIVPKWQAQPWYPLFKSLLISDTICFCPNEQNLISHSSSQMHKTITLVAGVLCGKHYREEAYNQHH
jgi:hypothetical protein